MIIKELDKLLKNNLIKSNKQYSNRLDEILVRYNSNKFKVGVLGEFSSGKSTLINAIIGQDILSHGTVETTATITNINNFKREDNIKMVINLKNGENITSETLEKILDFSTTKGCDVADTVENVMIYTDLKNSEFTKEEYKELIIVDTPGLNGIADKHREITLREIKSSHCLLYVLQKNGISTWDRDFLKILLTYHNNFIFIQNFIDEIKKGEGETVEKKLNTLSVILEKIIKDNNLNINYKIIGISALKALCGRDYSIKRLYRNDDVELNEEKRKNLIKDSNIEELESEIKHLVCNEGSIKIRATRHSLIKFLDDVILREVHYLNEERIRIEDTDEYRDIRRVKRNIKELSDNKDNIIEALQNLIDSQFIKYRKVLIKDVESSLNLIYENVIQLIREERNYEALMNTTKYIIILNKQVQDLNSKLNENEELIIQEIYKNTLTRISSYTGESINKELKIKTSEIKNYTKNEFRNLFDDKKNEILSKKNEYYEVRESLKEALNKNLEITKEYKYENDKYVVDGIMKERLEINFKKNLTSLGAIPNREDNEENIRIREGRDGVLGFILGTKIINKIIAGYSNKSNEEWKRRKREIEINYVNQKRDIECEMIKLKKNINTIEDELLKNSFIIERSRDKVEFLKEQIKIKEDELTLYESKAKGDFLKLRKKELSQGIEEYLFGNTEDKKSSVIDIIINKIDEDFSCNKKLLQDEIVLECTKFIKREEERINAIINGSTSIEGYKCRLEAKEKDIDELKSIMSNLEVMKIE
ncbi:MAG: dynamin family protein [Clostridium sp.]